MTKTLITLALLLSPFTAAASPSFENATFASAQGFKADFKADNGVEAPEPVGFFLERNDKEVVTTVYYQRTGFLSAMIYGCYQQEDSFHCQRENRADLGPYIRTSARYSSEDMAKSVALALKVFVKDAAPESTIYSIKLWEGVDNIRYSIRYVGDRGPDNFYVACHYHGTELDCHPKRNAGPGEPN